MATVLVRGTAENYNRSDRVAVSIATSAAMRFNKKVLILPLTSALNPLEVLMGQRLKENKIKSRGYTFDDSGIDALFRRIEQGPITAEGFADVCVSVLKESNAFDIAPVSKRPDFAEYVPTAEVYLQKILKHANACYDLVVVLTDACHGDVLHLGQKLCDKEVTVIAQGYKTDVDATPDSLYVINNYDGSSKFTYKYMKKLYDISTDTKMFPFPYNIRFKDACRESNAIEFLVSNVNEDQLEDNFIFLDDLKRLTAAVLGIEKPTIAERQFVERERASTRK